MNENVDVFAAAIRKDPRLQGGFNCAGFSQNWLSVHGTGSGVAGFPRCDPDGLLGPVCKQISHLCGDLAYTKLTQKILFQATNTEAYKRYSQIAEWNGEGYAVNSTYKENFVKVKRLIMVKAGAHSSQCTLSVWAPRYEKDSMIFPSEGEWWGHFADGDLNKVLTMKETKWYNDDTFGLKTVDK
ncbi:MAG: hypothetical protein SGPRY_009454, partial [Prymnesium sp.]